MAGERSGIQNPFTPEEVAEGIAGLRAKVGQEGMAKLEEAAQMMHEGRKPLLDEMFASGLISEGQLESFKNRDEYATFNVQDFLEPTMGRAPGGKIF